MLEGSLAVLVHTVGIPSAERPLRLQGTIVIHICFFYPDRTDTTHCVYERISAASWSSRSTIRSNFFSPNWGEPLRRGDHFWVRSRVDVHLNFAALACHLSMPEFTWATDERICVLALGMCFFLFRFFLFFRYIF